MNSSYDAVIIGSGAGGGTVAYRLTRAGMRVLLLEQGPRFNPLQDYPLGRDDWERWDHFEKENPDSYVSAVQELAENAVPLMSTRFGRRLSRTNKTRFKYARASGVGGSTLRYQAETHRFSEHAFRMKSLFGIGEDWPITYKDLAPFYREAEEILGVAGDHDNPFRPPQEPYPMEAHPLGCPSRKIKTGAAKLGLTLHPNSLAIPSRPYRGRPACIYCRGCGYGCVIGDKGSVDVAMIDPAMATGKLTIKTGAKALQIKVNKEGKAESVIWKGKNGIEKSYGKKIIVSCGAIETPRLLLNSTSKLFPDGLANSSGKVGAYLMTHLSFIDVVLFDSPLKSYQGLPIDSRIWDYSSPEMTAKQGGGFALGVMGAPEGIVSPSRFAAFLAPGWGKSHKQYMQQYYGAHSAIFGVAEHIPRKDNRVSLSDKKDPDGIPKAHVAVTMHDNDLELLKHMKRRCHDLAEASGTKVIGTFSSLDTMGSTHVGGTTRMGNDPQRSVVNKFGQCHDVRNLFVADNSVFVTQGGGDSPALTIMALALRTADHIVTQAKKNNF
ncbi:MAG: GMC family oxidoreductase [Desulfobulbales bacterium]|nr:GMC family oxidoreductase [Desulfobulbales bacterium]